MCGKVGVDDVGLYLGERWCLILVAKLTVGWMVEWDLYSHQEQWGQQICWHGDEFWDSHKGAGGIQSRSGEILMYHIFTLVEPHVLSNCAHSTFVSLLVCICRVVLVHAYSPCVPSVWACSPLFALVQPHGLSICAFLTFGWALLPPHVILVKPRAKVMISHIYLLDIIVYGTKHTVFNKSSC